MPGPAELAGRCRLGLAALLLVLVAAAALPAGAEESDAARAARWAAFATEAQDRITAADTPTETLEAIRVQLVEQRGEALALEQAKQPAVDELNKRIQAIGPPPAEGAQEAPEVADLRRDLQQQLTTAQAPVQTAQEAAQRADTQIAAIDRVIRARFSAELLSRGASPLAPSTWLTTFEELQSRLADYRGALNDELTRPDTSAQARRQIPTTLLLIIAGLVLAFMVRRWLIEWLERRLERTTNHRTIAWLVALRNVARLVVPTVGAGLLFAAFDPSGLLARTDQGRFFSIPPFVMILIGTGWLNGSLIAPKHKAFRLVPLEDDEARQAARTTWVLGLAVSFSYLFAGLALRWDLSTTTQSAMQVPLVLLGALALWRGAQLMHVAQRRMAAAVHGDSSDAPGTMIALRFLFILVRVIRATAVAAPALAALGFLPLASFLVFRTALALGLFGGTRVVFDLLNKSAQVLLASPTKDARDDGGLIPVVVAALIGLAALPLLAMILGARASDIADFWRGMREGVTFGGIRLSATAVVTLILVFALGSGLTRLFQSLLRSTVLPRTKLDAGGRNALLAGVGYLGFAASAIAAVSAAGLDLSNLAIVAGALSVGIGFGMQNIVSNFVSGVILLVERPVKEGDWIEVGGFSGYVRGIKVRSTEIETFDRAIVILPNSDLIAGTVLNRTHRGLSGRLQVPVSVTYDADPKKVEEILIAIAEEQPLVLQEPSPRVLFMQLGADSMDFELRCWLRDVNFSLSVRSDMNFEIIDRFAKAGIRIQYYGRDLPPSPPSAPELPPEPEAVALLRAKQERGAV
ncbi:MAG: DUF3772 domain-containing protein [Amaricoccus sp.]